MNNLIVNKDLTDLHYGSNYVLRVGSDPQGRQILELKKFDILNAFLNLLNIGRKNPEILGLIEYFRAWLKIYDFSVSKIIEVIREDLHNIDAATASNPLLQKNIAFINNNFINNLIDRLTIPIFAEKPKEPPVKEEENPFYVVVDPIKVCEERSEEPLVKITTHTNWWVVGMAVMCLASTFIGGIAAFVDSITPPVQVYNPELPSPYCLLTSYTSDSEERLAMSQLVAQDQKLYAQEQGYSYLEYPYNLAKRYEPYWSKIAAINRILNNKESALAHQPKWLVWLDDDAIIRNHNVQIEEVIRYYENQNPALKVLMTKDAMSHLFPNIPLNTGVIIVKNDEWSRQFFEEIWEMRNRKVPNNYYTYGNCPQQSCLHEQQAISDFLKRKGGFKEVQLIDQRDVWAINTFCRANHYDLNRDMTLSYDADLPESRCRKGDFISQCTGLATKGSHLGSTVVKNLRLDCIKRLLS